MRRLTDWAGAYIGRRLQASEPRTAHRAGLLLPVVVLLLLIILQEGAALIRWPRRVELFIGWFHTLISPELVGYALVAALTVLLVLGVQTYIRTMQRAHRLGLDQ